jgi:hypothetical protein
MKTNLKCVKYDNLLAIVIAFLMFTNTFSIGFYLAGLLNLGEFFLLISLCYWLTYLVIIVCFTLMTIWILWHWREYKFSEKIKRLIIVFLMIILFPWAVMWVLAEGPPFGITYLKGFRQRMIIQAKIPAIQAWMSSFSVGKERGAIGRELWPLAIKKLSPDRVEYYSSEYLVDIEWQGMGILWGLTIGPETTQTPENDYGRYRMTLTSGAYVWLIETR